MTLGALGGMRVVESPMLPLDPTPGQDARRIVRHGLADVLAWLGEDVGPAPGAQTHILLIGADIHASAALVGQFKGATL